MRGKILSGLLAALLLTGAVQAAPTCKTRTGTAIRCGADGAMPVDCVAPERDRADPLGGNGAALLKVTLGLALFLAFIALLPPFDGSKTSDWEQGEKKN